MNRTVVLAVLLALAAGTTGAQEWPNKPVRVIVPFPPGGGTDTVARPLTAKLSQLALEEESLPRVEVHPQHESLTVRKRLLGEHCLFSVPGVSVAGPNG